MNGMYADEQEGMMSAAGQYVGQHLLSRDQRMMRMPGPGGHYPAAAVDDPIVPLHNGTANNSIFRYDDGAESPPNGSDLADSFVSSRKKRQREYRLIQQKLSKDSQIGQNGSNRFCRQCCNGQLVPDYCSIF